MDFPFHQIAQSLRDGCPDQGLDTALSDWLALTDSRAVGLWRLVGDELFLLSFAAKEDMALEVQEGFTSATKQVALTQTRLGIVSAVRNRAPVVARVDAGPDGLVDSASWLAKFQAQQSLSVPIISRDKIIGVMAMSTANPFAEGDEVWNLLTAFAERLGQ